MISGTDRQGKYSLWKGWLLHACLIWMAINVNDAITYLYKVKKWGPYLFKSDGTPVTFWERFTDHNVYQGGSLIILFAALLTEINYRYIFRRHHILIFIGSSLVAGVIIRLFVVVINYWNSGFGISGPDIASVMLIAGYVFCYALTRDFIFRKISKAEKRYEHAKAELLALKAHLHPHFFFNTLNNLYGIALQENAVRTSESIDRLSGLMRYVMSNTEKNFAPVAEELQFIEDYLQLQHIRIPEKEHIRIHTKISYDDKPALVPPLLLIPFVENAFKYGISMDRDCYVHILIRVENRQLELKTENKILPAHNRDNQGGTGIQNSRRRLQLLYPGRHQLQTSETDGIFKVALRVDLLA